MYQRLRMFRVRESDPAGIVRELLTVASEMTRHEAADRNKQLQLARVRKPGQNSPLPLSANPKEAQRPVQVYAISGQLNRIGIVARTVHRSWSVIQCRYQYSIASRSPLGSPGTLASRPCSRNHRLGFEDRRWLARRRGMEPSVVHSY